MNLTTQTTQQPLVMPVRCTSCHKPTTWKVGSLPICSDCIVLSCRRSIQSTSPVRTKSGWPVRIYGLDGAGEFSTHGAYQGPNGWVLTSWNAYGDCWTGIEGHSLMVG